MRTFPPSPTPSSPPSSPLPAPLSLLALRDDPETLLGAKCIKEYDYVSDLLSVVDGHLAEEEKVKSHECLQKIMKNNDEVRVEMLWCGKDGMHRAFVAHPWVNLFRVEGERGPIIRINGYRKDAGFHCTWACNRVEWLDPKSEKVSLPDLLSMDAYALLAVIERPERLLQILYGPPPAPAPQPPQLAPPAAPSTRVKITLDMLKQVAESVKLHHRHNWLNPDGWTHTWKPLWTALRANFPYAVVTLTVLAALRHFYRSRSPKT